MKLFHSARSPFVRKVMISAHELDLASQIELLPSNAHIVDRDAAIVAHNPLGQVPTLLLDDGTVLADSSVICAYLDSLKPGFLFPSQASLRWRTLTEQAFADGLMEAAVAARCETAVRPTEKQWDRFFDALMDKVDTTLANFEKRATSFGNRFEIGAIAIACGLSYLDFRFADLDWRNKYSTLGRWHTEVSVRPSMRATTPS